MRKEFLPNFFGCESNLPDIEIDKPAVLVENIAEFGSQLPRLRLHPRHELLCGVSAAVRVCRGRSLPFIDPFLL